MSPFSLLTLCLNYKSTLLAQVVNVKKFNTEK